MIEGGSVTCGESNTEAASADSKERGAEEGLSERCEWMTPGWMNMKVRGKEAVKRRIIVFKG